MENINSLFEFIESKTSKMVELQTLLTSKPALSPESEGDGELEKCIALEQWLKNEGFSEIKQCQILFVDCIYCCFAVCFHEQYRI